MAKITHKIEKNKFYGKKTEKKQGPSSRKNPAAMNCVEKLTYFTNLILPFWMKSPLVKFILRPMRS